MFVANLESHNLLLLAFLYAGALFFAAAKVESAARLPKKLSRIMYALSLAVYCSSWTFFGAVGMAANTGWGFFAIYLGPMLMFIVGWPFLRRLLVISSRNRVTSIADFIGSRYGKQQFLAATVTVIAVIGTLPYIALQLRAVAHAWATIDTPLGEPLRIGSGTSFVSALVMAWFAILFGTRVVNSPNRFRGLVSAIAIESLVKLLGFVAVAWLAWRLLDNPVQSIGDYFFSAENVPDSSFITQTLLAMVAIVCLPRQFHVMVVEAHSRADVRWARFTFPLYLLLFSLCVLPIAVAGTQYFAASEVSADLYVLQLPMALSDTGVTAIAFIGGLSAATGMIIIACVTLSIMISNELVVPLLLLLSQRVGFISQSLATNLRVVRRIAVVSVMIMAWWVESSLVVRGGLASLGLISFAAAAQFMPALLAGLYWQRGHRHGVFAGLVGGMLVWCYTLLIPALLSHSHDIVVSGPFDIALLRPTHLLGVDFGDSLTHGVIWSLAVNCLLFVGVSRYSRFNTLDLRQAEAFTNLRSRFRFQQHDFELTAIETRQLQAVVLPLLGEIRSSALWREFEQRLGHRLLPHDKVPRFVLRDVESSIAAVVGAVSAHRIVELLRKQKPMQVEDFVRFVGGTNDNARFSQELLQTTLENIPQGISVVDANLNLVAWNTPYEKMFSFPPRLLYVGCPIARVYEFNARRGYIGSPEDDIDEIVEKRLNLLLQGSPYRIERWMPNGMMMEIRGAPLGNSGYVTTYLDVTDYQTVLDQLALAKSSLEERVAERTAELSAANDTMRRENQLRARLEQELNSVYASKSQFLSAASHDLLQPINAARLFVGALQHKAIKTANEGMISDVQHIDSALQGAESLINSLREIARLDSGRLTPKREHFRINELLKILAHEFAMLGERRGIELRWVDCRQWVYTDKAQLRRVLQNFLSNALRYTEEGAILLGCRYRPSGLEIQVWDTGPGIAKRDLERIFYEFERLSETRAHDGQKGLGLGLSITKRISDLLGHPINVNSEVGRGSMFSMTVPLGVPQQERVVPVAKVADLQGVTVLAVDNEARILAGMQSLLEQWGCYVVTASTLGEAITRWKDEQPPMVVLADYHLDGDVLGVDVLDALSLHWQMKLTAIIISADDGNVVRNAAESRGYRYLPKPVQPAALRGLMRNLVRQSKA